MVILACLMTSCFPDTPSQTTPQISLISPLVNPQFVGDTIVGAKDTLYGHYDEELGISYLDTMSLGDTLLIHSYYTSNMNNLVSITSTYDTLALDLWFGLDPEKESVKKALAAGSDPQKGILYFNPMYSLVSFPIYIVPQKTGSFPIKLTVTSDSKFPTNFVLFTLPVK